MNKIVIFMGALALFHAKIDAQVTANESLMIHSAGSMHVDGDGKLAQPGNIETNANSVLMYIKGDFLLGDSTGTATFSSSPNGEVWVDGNVTNNSPAHVVVDHKGDFVLNNVSANQRVSGGFQGGNNFHNLIVNKNSGYHVDMDKNIEVDSLLKFANAGYIRTDTASSIVGSTYAAKMRLNNANENALMNSTIAAGNKDNVIEGRLERKTATNKSYTYPVSLDVNNSLVGGAQIATLTNRGGTGYVEGSFTRSEGGKDSLSAQAECGGKGVKSIIDHGFWTMNNADSGVTLFDMGVQAHGVQNTYGGNRFTLAKRKVGTSLKGYSLLGIDPMTGCAGFPNTDLVKRVGYTSFSEIAIAPYDVLSVEIPNFMTPNNDNQNDVFDLSGLMSEYPNLKLMIYNRWGNLVYRSTGTYNNQWGGTYQLNNEPLPDGVYYYLIELTPEFGKTRTGFVEIMRN